MTQRFIPGIGRADYTPVEDELARTLLEQGKHDEVRLLHDLKVSLDATANPADDCWHAERERIADRAGTQEALL